MADVSLQGMTRRFGDTLAVDALDLDIADGELVVLLGPTGAGKTTTLRLIAGLERADAGRLCIAGRDATQESPAERDVAFVFQQYSLYPHMSVYDNIAFPLRSPARRMPVAEIDSRVQAIAGMLHIEHKLANKATRLSGGEMQRVAIARALVRQPAIYLMDEPLSSLDAKLRAELRLELKRIQREIGATILYVTHDQIEAMTMADRIGVLRKGRLVQVGTPRQIYEQPADTYVASRLGSPAINLLPADLLPAPALPESARFVGARTEHLQLADTGHGAPCEVERIEHLGDQCHLHLRLGEHRLVTLVDAHTPLASGDRVGVRLHAPLCFDGDGRRLPTETTEARP